MVSKIIGVKIGSQLLADKQGVINEKFIDSVCEQLAYLKWNREKVFLVTSGAVASDPNRIRSKNLRAAIGQSRLLEKYRSCLEICYGLEVAQFLPTHYDLQADANIFLLTITEALQDPKVIPIINYNDPMDSKELEARYADNDRLFQRVCELVKADMAIIAFPESGLLDLEGNLIQVFKVGKKCEKSFSVSGGNKLGHGKNGMETKHTVLSELSALVSYVCLAPGKESNFILKAVARQKNFGTVYVS